MPDLHFRFEVTSLINYSRSSWIPLMITEMKLFLKLSCIFTDETTSWNSRSRFGMIFWQRESCHASDTNAACAVSQYRDHDSCVCIFSLAMRSHVATDNHLEHLSIMSPDAVQAKFHSSYYDWNWRCVCSVRGMRIPPMQFSSRSIIIWHDFVNVERTGKKKRIKTEKEKKTSSN